MESVLNLVNLIFIHEDCWTNYESDVIVNAWIIIMKNIFSHDLDFIFQWSAIKKNIEKAFRLSGKQNVLSSCEKFLCLFVNAYPF